MIKSINFFKNNHRGNRGIIVIILFNAAVSEMNARKKENNRLREELKGLRDPSK